MAALVGPPSLKTTNSWKRRSAGPVDFCARCARAAFRLAAIYFCSIPTRGPRCAVDRRQRRADAGARAREKPDAVKGFAADEGEDMATVPRRDALQHVEANGMAREQRNPGNVGVSTLRVDPAAQRD